MKLFTALFGFSVFAYGVAVLIQPTDAVPSSDKIVFVAPGFSIQLQANATYYDQAIKIPWTPARTYSNIRIIGSNTRLVSPPGTETPVIWVGVGWDDWDAPKLEGIEFRGLVIEQTSLKNPGSCKGVFVEFTKGTVIRDCEFVDNPFEAIYEGGGNSNEQLHVCECRAYRCGRRYASGPLAAFNLNGFGSNITNSSADQCGWGLESGGTELRVVHCRFTDAPMALGSTVCGCSNQIISRNTFERSPITVSNGIGKMADIRITDNTLTDSPVCWNGAATTNRVQLPRLPFYAHTSVISGNNLVGRLTSWQGAGIGQGLRLTAQDDAYPSMPLKVFGNTFDIAQPNWSIVSQGKLANTVEFFDNSFTNKSVGAAYLYLAGGVILPDPTPMMKFSRNRLPPDATFTINTGTAETKRAVN